MKLKPLLILFAFYLLLVSPALAHKVSVFAYVEGGHLYTESYFPDGRPVKGGHLLVISPQGKTLVEGKTDSDGRYECKLPQVSDLKIVIEASMGHKNSYLLKKTEVEAGR